MSSRCVMSCSKLQTPWRLQDQHVHMSRDVWSLAYTWLEAPDQSGTEDSARHFCPRTPNTQTRWICLESSYLEIKYALSNQETSLGGCEPGGLRPGNPGVRLCFVTPAKLCPVPSLTPWVSGLWGTFWVLSTMHPCINAGTHLPMLFLPTWTPAQFTLLTCTSNLLAVVLLWGLDPPSQAPHPALGHHAHPPTPECLFFCCTYWLRDWNLRGGGRERQSTGEEHFCDFKSITMMASYMTS